MMFHFFTAFGALLLCFALIWHDQPAKPIVERRARGKEPARRRTFAALRKCPKPSLLPTLKSK